MLRRTQAIKLPPDDVQSMRAEIERAFTPDPNMRDPTQLPPEIERPFGPRAERGADARPRMRASLGIRPSRIMLVFVAIAAGGAAAWLAVQRETPAPEPVMEVVTEVVPEPRVQVLVAASMIGVGQKLSPQTVQWMEWPENSVRPEYITDEAVPDAMTHMAGAIARYEIFPGEPIREQKLAQPGDGYLSVVLEPGMRAVAVPVTPESASGGFILPNDHVDVVLTRSTDRGPDSRTLLSNVRVLAINGQIGGTEPADDGEETQPQGFSEFAIATLALDQTQGEVIVGAQSLGKLTLVLRSMTDATSGETQAAELSAANQAIRLTSPFWNRTRSNE